MTIRKETVVEAITVLYIILFLYTGISKMIDYKIFKEQIATSPILKPVASYVAALLPWTEFFMVLLLIIPKWRKKGLYASLVLMIVFTLYIIGILIFNRDIPCSCGGIIELLSWKQHVFLNSVFIALAVIGVIFKNQLRKETLIGWTAVLKKAPGKK